MKNSTTIERIADLAADCLYQDLLDTEDFSAFEQTIAFSARDIAAMALRKCIERFDKELQENIPQGWSVHDHVKRTIITLVGTLSFTRAIFIDNYGRRRAWADELLGIAPRSRLSACAFIWIASHAAYLSYRRTAHEFRALTSARISHVTVMNVVHSEGRLLEESGAEYSRSGPLRISQDTLFVESDGLWVHVQEAAHRRRALPRFLYEQARKTKSFELKLAALYAGKKEVAPGRFKRSGLCLTCSDEDASAFWERVWKMVCENYELDDVSRIAVGADGAEWCGSARLEAKAPARCSVDFTLDSFHLMQKITRAFPDKLSKENQWATYLAVRGKGKQLAQISSRIAAKMKPGSARDRVCDLASYALAHASGIRPSRKELGTMEGTNAHVGAARLKGQGRSWSRRGAQAMCLIRCALATGRNLVAPPVRQWFTRKEIAAKTATLPSTAGRVEKTVGKGWEPPQYPKALPKSAAISLSYRIK